MLQEKNKLNPESKQKKNQKENFGSPGNSEFFTLVYICVTGHTGLFPLPDGSIQQKVRLLSQDLYHCCYTWKPSHKTQCHKIFNPGSFEEQTSNH